MKNLTLEVTFSVTNEEEEKALLSKYFSGAFPEIIKQAVTGSSSDNAVELATVEINAKLEEILRYIKVNNVQSTSITVPAPKEPEVEIRDAQQLRSLVQSSEPPQRKRQGSGLFSKKTISRV